MSSTDDWIRLLWYAHTMAHYVLNEVLIHSVTWINLKSMRFKNKKDCDVKTSKDVMIDHKAAKGNLEGGKIHVLYLYRNDS